MAYEIQVKDTSTGDVKMLSVAELISILDDTLVTKEEGKGLSANDFTNALKTKLDALPAAADLPTDISDLTDNTNLLPDTSALPTITVGTAGQNPTTTPSKIGDFFFKPPSTVYFAIGTESASDWMQM